MRLFLITILICFFLTSHTIQALQEAIQASDISKNNDNDQPSINLPIVKSGYKRKGSGDEDAQEPEPPRKNLDAKNDQQSPSQPQAIAKPAPWVVKKDEQNRKPDEPKGKNDDSQSSGSLQSKKNDSSSNNSNRNTSNNNNNNGNGKKDSDTKQPAKTNNPKEEEEDDDNDKDNKKLPKRTIRMYNAAAPQKSQNICLLIMGLLGVLSFL